MRITAVQGTQRNGVLARALRPLPTFALFPRPADRRSAGLKMTISQRRVKYRRRSCPCSACGRSAHGCAPVGAPFAFATMRGRTSVLVEAAGQSAKDGRGMGISLAPPRRTGAPLHVPKLKSRRQTAPLFLYGPCYDPIEPDRGDIRRKSILGLHGIDFRDHFRIIGVPIIQGQDLQIRKLLL